MVVLKVSFLLSKNLIDPSVVKVSPYYFLYGKYLFFCVVLFYFTFILQQKGDLWS